MMTGETNAARLLAETLAVNGVDRVFTGSGACPLALIDALLDRAIAVVPACLEASAALMAEASAKLTGKPGVLLVSGTSGAALAAAGLHLARHDETPLILLVAGLERGTAEGGVFAETAPRDLFGSTAKWAAEIDAPDRIVATVTRAFTIATSGRPGPVVVLLPEDLPGRSVAAPDAIRPAPIVETHPGAASMWDLQKRLWAAKRPLAVLGGSRWSEKACRQFARFTDKFDLPVACSSGRQMLFDHLDPHYVGVVGPDVDPALAARIDAADLLLMVGGETMEAARRTGAHLDAPARTLVHVDASAEAFGRVSRPDLAIHASPSAFAAAAEALEPPPAGVAWVAWREAARTEHLAWSEAIPAHAGAVQPAALVAHLRSVLPPEAILASGADPVSVRLRRHWRFRRFASQVAPLSGAMGYALPAGIAAELAFPDRPVVVVTDAEDFQRTSPDLATARRSGVALVVLLFDDGVAATGLPREDVAARARASRPSRPDFVAIARAYGAFAAVVETSEAFAPAFDAALAHGGPTLLHIRLDPEALTSRTTPAKIREASSKRG